MIVRISGMKLAGLYTVKEIGMGKEEIRKLQNHFNNGIKEGFQAKVYYQNGDRVHLKGTNVNGTVIAVIFKDDRKYPYLKINWDSFNTNDSTVFEKTQKKFYDPFDVVKEIKIKHKEEKKKKVYENFYLNEKNK